MTELESGKIIKLPLHDAKEIRGARIGIARRARIRGYKVEFRDLAEGGIALRKGNPITAKPSQATASASSATGKRRGRPPKVRPETEG